MLTILVIGGATAAGWIYWQSPQIAGTRATPSPAAPAPGPATARVQVGEDYYAFVKLIELRPDNDGSGWDVGGSNAPDIYYQTFWNDAMVFESAERDDRLIAEWDLLRLDLKDALLSGQVEVATAMNCPLVNIAEGGKLTINIYDDDAMKDDKAGSLELTLTELQPGENVFEPGYGGVKRLILDMVPRSTPVPDLLQRASSR